MKNLLLSLLTVAALSTIASAHHMSPSDMAGGNMSDDSGHLVNPAILY